MEEIERLLRDAVCGLVDHPEGVDISWGDGDRPRLYLNVDYRDGGAVRGKHGVVIDALTDLVRAWSGKRGLRVRLELEEPE